MVKNDFTAVGALLDQRIAERAQLLKAEQQRTMWRQTDLLFAGLLILQWLAGIMLAVYVSPRAWNGLESRVHPHVWTAVWLGGVIAAFPVLLAIVRPGETATRMVIAVAQMCHSALLIHLSGGRIETHFHVFGSLAFLSFYRDWRVLVPATIVVALDHAIRGIFWPESVFGVLAASPWRWIEHAGWVVFEDVILVWACIRGARELTILAARQAQLEAINERVEAEVARKTERLESVTQELVATARRAGMAEIATGVLHNVGNVLNSVNVSTNVVAQKLKASEIASLIRAGELLNSHRDDMARFLTDDERGKRLPAFLTELAQCIGQEQNELLEEIARVATGLEHIKEIVGAQQQHAKAGLLRERVDPGALFEQAIAIDKGSDGDVPIRRQFEPIAPVALDKHKVLQILINLLSNAKRAMDGASQQGQPIVVTTRTVQADGAMQIVFEVSDSGVGIEPENLTRIFSHGFTTHNEGHGFGLHSAANAAREMGGNLTVASDGPGKGATFTLVLPREALSESEELVMSRRKQVISCQ